MSDTPTVSDFDIWLEEFLSGLLERIGLDIWLAQMDIDENTRTYTIELDGEDKARAIGKNGQMLGALQHLVVAAASNRGVHGVKVIIDVDGYRSRRDHLLTKEAKALAKEVKKTGKPRDLEPMPARQRRIVHMAVTGIDGVTTESHGEGAGRFVRLVPVQQ